MAVANLNLPQLEPNLHVILMIIQAKKWRTNSEMLPGPIMSKNCLSVKRWKKVNYQKAVVMVIMTPNLMKKFILMANLIME